MKQKRDNNSTGAKEKVLDYYFSDFRLFTIQEDLTRWRHVRHLENNDYNENHGSEAADDDSDDEGHGCRHAWKFHIFGFFYVTMAMDG